MEKGNNQLNIDFIMADAPGNNNTQCLANRC